MNFITQNRALAKATKALFYSFLATLLISCIPVEEGDSSSFTIGGTISGLSDSGSLSLQNNSVEVMSLSSNGPFSFTILADDIGDYSVTTLVQPSNPDQICTIENGSGTLTDESISDINVVCTTTQYTLKGTVSGLSETDSLTLQNNAGDDLVISDNGSFTFATPIDHFTPYSITVLTQPTIADQTCVVANPTGNLESTTVIDISCATGSYIVGGTVSGFSEVGSLVLQNNSGDDLTISANGTFSFATSIFQSDTYSVTVLTQPTNPNQTCTVSNAGGNIVDENIIDVSVVCVTDQYTVGGIVSDLNGTGLVLQNNAGDNLTIDSNGAFTFATQVDDLNDFSVTVLTQPSAPKQTCDLANNEGSISTANITDISVTCSTTLYVSIDDLYASDSGTGTESAPFITISAAIEFAGTLFGGVDINIAEGDYQVDSSGVTAVQMVEGVSLYGGYDSSNWNNRDPATFPTIITDIDTGTINRTVYFDEGITNATVLDGFTINGSNSNTHTYAVYIRMSSPTISNNIINANGNSYYAYAIKNFNGSPEIFDNILNGGNGSSATYGINNQTTGSPIVYNNQIDAGGGGGSSFGISGSGGGTTTAYNNIIFGGNASSTHAIQLEGAHANLYNNTLSGGTGSSYAHAIKLKSESTAILNNNIMFTEGGIYRYCILENGGSVENNVTVLNNNNLFDCPSALYKDNFRGVSLTDIADTETELTSQGFVASGNVSQDPGFVNAATADWHLGSTSPCLVSKGGIDGATNSWVFDDDFEALSRTGNGTMNWSMGAYEYDGTCQ